MSIDLRTRRGLKLLFHVGLCRRRGRLFDEPMVNGWHPVNVSSREQAHPLCSAAYSVDYVADDFEPGMVSFRTLMTATAAGGRANNPAPLKANTRLMVVDAT